MSRVRNIFLGYGLKKINILAAASDFSFLPPGSFHKNLSRVSRVFYVVCIHSAGVHCCCNAKTSWKQGQHRSAVTLEHRLCLWDRLLPFSVTSSSTRLRTAPGVPLQASSYLSFKSAVFPLAFIVDSASISCEEV